MFESCQADAGAVSGGGTTVAQVRRSLVAAAAVVALAGCGAGGSAHSSASQDASAYAMCFVVKTAGDSIQPISLDTSAFAHATKYRQLAEDTAALKEAIYASGIGSLAVDDDVIRVEDDCRATGQPAP